MPFKLLHDGRTGPKYNATGAKQVQAVLENFMASDAAHIAPQHHSRYPPDAKGWDEIQAARQVWAAMCHRQLICTSELSTVWLER